MCPVDIKFSLCYNTFDNRIDLFVAIRAKNPDR